MLIFCGFSSRFSRSFRYVEIAETLGITGLQRFCSWLRGKDLNLRPPGYEPDELPTAPPRDVIQLNDWYRRPGSNRYGYYYPRDFKSRASAYSATPAQSNLIKIMAPRVGLEPTTYRLTAGCSAIELHRNISRISMRLDYYNADYIPCQHQKLLSLLFGILPVIVFFVFYHFVFGCPESICR